MKTKRPASTAKMTIETTSEAAKALALWPENLSTLAFVWVLSRTPRRDILLLVVSYAEPCQQKQGVTADESVEISLCKHED